jgi:hypothetical protein
MPNGQLLMQKLTDLYKRLGKVRFLLKMSDQRNCRLNLTAFQMRTDERHWCYRLIDV